MRELRNVYKILIVKPEGKRLLRRPRHKWKNNIIMDLSEKRLEGVDSCHLIYDRDKWLAGSCENSNELVGSH
jgi:hypothetical protein